jgi:conjugative relaxase-like TrwC/TraI family protein
MICPVRTTRLTTRTAQYYLNDLATELGPFSLAQSTRTPGQWMGAGSAGLGMAGSVRDSDLGDVLDGQVPRRGRSLTPRQHLVSAYDLTFSAPKSASVLMALESRQIATEVLEAHHAAVAGAVQYLEAHALGVRRTTEEGREVHRANGIIAAGFTHGVSRALDPHLHTHVVVANMAHGDDGRWSAIDGRGFYAHGPAAGAVYQAHLRSELVNRLGLQWRDHKQGGYQITAVDPALLACFSRRRAEIAQHKADWDVSSRRGDHVAWATTRENKASDLNYQELRAQWTSLASDLGIEPSPFRGHRDRTDRGRSTIEERRFALTLRDTEHGTVTRRDVVRAWCGALDQGAPAREVEACVDVVMPSGARDGEVGVGESEIGTASLVPRRYQIDALGPRPGMAADLAKWSEGVVAIENYRERWGVDAPLSARGTEQSTQDLARLPVRQLASYLGLEKAVDDVRRFLGRTDHRSPELAHSHDRG